MDTGFAFRDIKTNLAVQRHEVWKIVMKVTREKLLVHKKKGTKYYQIAKQIGVPNTRIAEIVHGKYMTKNTLKLLILYEYVKVDDVLPKITRDQVRILKTIIPEWS